MQQVVVELHVSFDGLIATLKEGPDSSLGNRGSERLERGSTQNRGPRHV